MGDIQIGDRLVEDMSDGELLAWMYEANEAYGGNRLQRKTAALWLATLRLLDRDGVPTTTRHLFYGLEGLGYVRKSDAGYNSVCYHVLQMRRRGVIPYGFIADNTRQRRKPATFGGLDAYLHYGAQAYRRALWDTEADYVEVWTEKDAIAGVLSDVTTAWDVPLMVVRGFVSETFAYEAADEIMAQTDRGKTAHLYYFGDWDPSGLAISADIERKLRDFGAAFTFTRLAVTQEQIEGLRLPTRPVKRTDSRAKNWAGACVEVDAIPSRTLRELCEGAIMAHIDPVQVERLQETEKAERRTLELMASDFRASPKLYREGWPMG